MIFAAIITTLTLIVLIVASYTDLKTREVPDWISYALMISALAIRAIFSVTEGWEILVSGILGFAICIGLAFFFYYTNQWGGADSKLLMGMGAVIGITIPFDSSSFTLLWFFLGLLLIGTVYGMGWMGYLAIKKHYKFLPVFKQKFKKHRKYLIPVIAIKLVFVIITVFYPFAWPFIPIPLLLFIIFLFINSVEHSCFHKKVKTKNLTEGDWLAEQVIVKNKQLMKKKTLVAKDIVLLQKKVKEVTIKEGIPFIPSFLLTYITLFIVQKFFPFVIPF